MGSTWDRLASFFPSNGYRVSPHWTFRDLSPPPFPSPPLLEPDHRDARPVAFYTFMPTFVALACNMSSIVRGGFRSWTPTWINTAYPIPDQLNRGWQRVLRCITIKVVIKHWYVVAQWRWDTLGIAESLIWVMRIANCDSDVWGVPRAPVKCLETIVLWANVTVPLITVYSTRCVEVGEKRTYTFQMYSFAKRLGPLRSNNDALALGRQ
jgi:hypothetical protein